MKTTESKNNTSKKETIERGVTKPKSNAASGLTELFEDSLKDIYWAEKALTKALPIMLKNASSVELKDAIDNHLTETEEQISRLEEVFKIIGKKATAKKCDAMEGLIEEAKGLLEETEIGVVRDAAIIAASQKIEHYEIATYGTLRQFAETLGLPEAATLLEQTLDEEKGADKILTEVAVNAVNLEAAEIE
ncbi:ferritin-like domain-containing protein [Flavobacterium sp. SORGH_AS_0622]|uniref:YciE/YciF ferroxidase family protein n=1 Tax=Flavobacterium sp. SORGH_AS_0622 TaxID=3041772 RepID=UPI0027819BC0|nr:ferritin-like domain-containing protein [Flavobacterium sp. SORGH_AS_0622]MDQ1165352.1 ferritin-like metal-binding protein YciE [Flavobacterium sp. SORGH_AS_0622]